MNDKTLNIIILNGQTHIENYSNIFIVSQELGRIEAVEKKNANNIFDYIFVPGDSIAVDKTVQNITGYRAQKGSNPNMKQKIDEETFEKLPAAIQSLYNKETESSIETTVLDNDIEVFDMNGYARKNKGLVIYSREEVGRNLPNLNFKKNKRAKVSYHTSYRDDAYLEVEFFVSDYNGEMKKILARKKTGGGYYADRRGSYHPDYPKTIETIKIPISKVPAFSAESKEQMEEKIQAYFDHIAMTHMLPESE